MDGFEFAPGDAEKLKALCERTRKAAKNNPCFTAIDIGDERFQFKFGSWFVRLCIDAFTSSDRQWHGSASCLEVIGDQPVQLPSGLIVKMPQEALLATQSWTDEHKRQARYLLGELFAPLIVEEAQPVHVDTGLFALHYTTPYKRR